MVPSLSLNDRTKAPHGHFKAELAISRRRVVRSAGYILRRKIKIEKQAPYELKLDI